MFAHIQLLNGFTKTLTYKVPPSLQVRSLEGMVVQVPLRNTKVFGLVIKLIDSFESGDFEIKEITKIESFPDDVGYNQFIKKVAHFNFINPIMLYHRLQNFLHNNTEEEKDDHEELEPALINKPEIKEVTLTEEQTIVVDYVKPFITQPTYAPTLLHGVTGSGKTEVYKKLIEECIVNSKSVILLLPEVSLAMQFHYLLEKGLPHVSIFGFHSASSVNEKKELWKALLDKKPILIIGVHLPSLLPVANLGLIIIDEEHENGFQEKKHPKINSKEVAIIRAHTYNIPILLGSATPSLSSIHNVTARGWRLFHLKNRFAGNFPIIQKVPLIDKSKQKRASFWITKELETALKECLAKKQQAIIYLNRRGYSFFVQCKTCGFIFSCSNCSVSLTLHMQKVRAKKPTTQDQSILFQEKSHEALLCCHYCGINKKMPASCPDCKAPEKEFLKKGVGTQQVVQILQELLPSAIIERADLDTTSKKKTWSQTVTLFKEQKIDILVGTKTITKGYHFPAVTLVGILWADLTLHFPQYDASESTLQQLIQVAGRAGRNHSESKVIMQVMQDHPIFNHMDEQKYMNFVEHEMEQRKELSFPPAGRLMHIELRHHKADQVAADALIVAKVLNEVAEKMNLPVRILGPAQPIVWKIQKVEMRQILIKAPNFSTLHSLISKININRFESSIFIIPS